MSTEKENEVLETSDSKSPESGNEQSKNKKKDSKNNVVTKESLSAVFALFTALALLMLFTGDLIFGAVGIGVTEVLLGLFGIFAYPAFIGFFYLSFTTFFDLKLVKKRKIGWYLALCVISIALIIHTATTAFSWELSDYLGNCFAAGGSIATSTVCGLLGGLLVSALTAMISPVGAIIVFSLLTLLFGYLFVETVRKKDKTAESKPKKWFFRKKEKVTAETQEEGQAPVEQEIAPDGYPATPYYTPRPAVTLPTQPQDAWARQASYSPFSAESPVAPVQDPSTSGRSLSREESRAFLFGTSPADAYNKNLFFDKTASVNNRPAAGQAPSYTQAYEQSFSAPQEPAPEKIVTDYTRPAPSYVHPSLTEKRQDDGLLRNTGLLSTEPPQEPISSRPAIVEDTTQKSVFEDSSFRATDRGFRRETEAEDLSRSSATEFIRGEDLTRESTKFDDGRQSETRARRDLFDEKTDDTLLDTSLDRGSRNDTFVSPFAERDFEDDSDFMPRAETPIREEKPTDRLSSRITESRIAEERSTRFVEPTPMEPPKKEEILPPVQVPKLIRPYSAPPLHYFDCTEVKPDCNQEEVEWNKQMILATLEGFGIKDATISSVTYGPTVTRYNIVTPINVSSKKIIGLAEQFAVNLHAENGVNVSFNYGDGATSIEVPNRKRQFVHLGCMLTGAGYVSAKPNSLTFTLGVDVSNEKVYGDVAKMTHLLVAGASGMGKSAFLRSLIISLVYKYSPQDLRLILIDPKMADFTLYTGIPHLVINEIICRPQQAVQSLRWAIGEMERRYEMFRKKSLAGTYVVNLDGYNANLEKGEEKLPKIVIIVDELADLMSVARKDVEDCIQRLTAKARAAGIHMILATQRPSVDVVTGVIKSNLPTRIAFAVSSEIDSRVILDTGGADKLLSMGDMMYSMAGFKNPVRVQAPYIDDAPAQAVINYIRENNDTDFNNEAMAYINNASAPTGSSGGASSNGEVEPVYIEALKFVIQTGSASISMLQRKCSVGFNKAGKIIEWMEEMHYIAEFDGSPKPRKTLITKEEFEQLYGEF